MLKDSVALLCRGESLKHIDLMPDVEEFIIVNGFSDELSYEPIRKKIGKKPITHVLSLGALAFRHPSGLSCFGAMLDNNNYIDFDIKKIVLPYITECLPASHKNPIIHNIKNARGDVIPVTNLSNTHKPFMIPVGGYPYAYPSCGMDSLGYATVEMKKKNIFVIGMDFYEKSGYLANNVSYEELKKRASVEGGILKEFLPMFISKHHNINFNFYTYTNFDKKSDNVVIHDISEYNLRK